MGEIEPRDRGTPVSDWVRTLPLIFLSDSRISADVVAAGRAGLVRSVGPRLYTTDTTSEPDEFVPRHAIEIANLRFPGSVVSHRSAFEMRPVDGRLFLTGPYEKTDRLPGLTIRQIQGPGPLPDDLPLMALYRASDARAYLENLRRTRRAGGVSRALERSEVERRLELHFRRHGEAGLNALRDRARGLATHWKDEKAFEKLDGIIGALQRTRRVPLSSPVAVARVASTPFDERRVELFGVLVDALIAHPIADRAAPVLLREERQNLALIDAYFSNFIEGTRFTVQEAVDIVVEGNIPPERPADGHDIRGTFELLVDDTEMTVSAAEFDQFEDFEAALKRRHHTITAGRPEIGPGKYKTAPNQAGNTLFVAPELVPGTLARGFELFKSLNTAFQRGAFAMFLVAEVHPFADGNGRLARAMMNAELSAGEQTRITIVTAYRTDYLGALRRLSRQNDPSPYIRMLDRAQTFTHRLTFDDLDALIAVLEACNAFDDTGRRIMKLPPLPSPSTR